MQQDFDILSFAGLSEDQPFVLAEPTLTDFRVVYSSSEIPSAEEVCTAIANIMEGEIEAAPVDPLDESTHWTMQVRIKGIPSDFIIWDEPINDSTKKELQVQEGWVLGMQTALHPDDPLSHFANLMWVLGSLPFEIHSICDLPTGRWFSKDVLHRIFIDETVEPQEEILWITRLIEAPENVEPEDRWLWLSTHGLNRCGKSELELLGVGGTFVNEALQLIDGLASLTFETPLPAAGNVISVGPELTVSISTCDDAIKKLLPEMPGHGTRDIPSAVITSPSGDSLSPQLALQILQGGSTAIAKSVRSTNRRAALAKKGWRLFLDVAKQIGASEHAACLVQVPFTHTEEEDSPTEYLWFTVVGMEKETVVAELAHTPTFATSISSGHSETFGIDDITDWLVMTPIGPLDPSDLEAIEMFKNQMQD